MTQLLLGAKHQTMAFASDQCPREARTGLFSSLMNRNLNRIRRIDISLPSEFVAKVLGCNSKVDIPRLERNKIKFRYPEMLSTNAKFKSNSNPPELLFEMNLESPPGILDHKIHSVANDMKEFNDNFRTTPSQHKNEFFDQVEDGIILDGLVPPGEIESTVTPGNHKFGLCSESKTPWKKQNPWGDGVMDLDYSPPPNLTLSDDNECCSEGPTESECEIDSPSLVTLVEAMRNRPVMKFIEDVPFTALEGACD